MKFRLRTDCIDEADLMLQKYPLLSELDNVSGVDMDDKYGDHCLFLQIEIDTMGQLKKLVDVFDEIRIYQDDYVKDLKQDDGQDVGLVLEFSDYKNK